MTIKSVTEASLREVVELLRVDKCVAMPTETVYGLAGNALSDSAIEEIYKIKKRPKINPLICHFHSLDQILNYVDLGETAMNLAKGFWPGPMTLVLNRRKDCKISNLATAGLETVAVRVPSHKTARRLIEMADIPLAAPSANLSGEVSPTSAKHVAESIGDHVDVILADGSSDIGLESTVIDCTGDRAVLLRHGAITADDCMDVLGYSIEANIHDDIKPKSPGQLLKHYAPSKPVRLQAVDVEKDEGLLAFGSTKFMPTQKIPDHHILNLSETGDLYEAAHNLFNYLRILDNKDIKAIAIMDIPDIGLGKAINDRIKRAAEE